MVSVIVDKNDGVLCGSQSIVRQAGSMVMIIRAISSDWLERYVDIVEVIGSNPISPTILIV